MKGKTAVVTGGASGLGLALARLLASKGAAVVIADINEPAARSAARAIEKHGGEAIARKLDVSKPRESERLISWAVRELGTLDYFFNNAGVSLRGETRDLTEADWKRVFDINLLGAIHAGNAAFKVMAAQGSGHLVNIASASGLLPLPVASPYSTSKFAIVGYSANLRIEGADLGVRVSAVCPAFIASGIRKNPAVNVPQDESFKPPFREMSAEQAARKILDGVERNRGRIVFPFYVHLLYWLFVFAPSLSERIGRNMMRKFRALRIKSG